MFQSIYSKAALPRVYFLLSVLLLGTFATSTAFALSPEQRFERQKHDAKAGYRLPIFKLAEMYKDGYGTPQNLQKALELYKVAAEKRYRRAERRIVEVEQMIASGKYNTKSADIRMAEIRQQIEMLEQEYNQLKESK